MQNLDIEEIKKKYKDRGLTTVDVIPITEPSEPIAPDDDAQKILDRTLVVKGDILEWVENAVTKAKGKNILEVKEMKDLAAIVKGIEDSVTPKTDDRPVVNILVQNLMEAKDDC